MHHCILSLATNRHQKSNLARARQCLGGLLSDMHFTSELWTQPMNSSRHDLYLNQLVEATTVLSTDELITRLKQIECDFGRTPQKRSLGIVPIDLDLLLYDGCRHHERDWERPYLQKLLPEMTSLATQQPLSTNNDK
jgi:2-amino-4-hydroxy-6-hydroxymethyldihydropteridine diphosphokinase